MSELQSQPTKVLTKTEIASNTVFGAIEMAQKRGAYSLKESADIYAAIQILTESVNQVPSKEATNENLKQD